MIFAEIEHTGDYSSLHAELVEFLCSHFPRVESGLQGDSWIWIFDSEEKLEIDTFYSMTHQIKSARAGPLVRKVIDILSRLYRLKLYQAPELEPHEEG